MLGDGVKIYIQRTSIVSCQLLFEPGVLSLASLIFEHWRWLDLRWFGCLNSGTRIDDLGPQLFFVHLAFLFKVFLDNVCVVCKQFCLDLLFEKLLRYFCNIEVTKVMVEAIILDFRHRIEFWEMANITRTEVWKHGRAELSRICGNFGKHIPSSLLVFHNHFNPILFKRIY